jgi:endoglucanase
MENFINGFPGHEHQFREGLRDVLGAEKTDYFFDKFLEYWFTEEDAKLFASFGFNSIRLPVSR